MTQRGVNTAVGGRDGDAGLAAVPGRERDLETVFKQALDFVNRAGAIAEAEGHHPDILLTWGKAEVKTYTHKIDGLTESDFILAAKFDEVPVPNQSRPAARGGEDDSDDGDEQLTEDFDDSGDAEDFENEEDFDDSD